MILSTTQTFQMQKALYQLITFGDIRVETHLNFNNTWEVFITNDIFEVLKFNRTQTHSSTAIDDRHRNSTVQRGINLSTELRRTSPKSIVND